MIFGIDDCGFTDIFQFEFLGQRFNFSRITDQDDLSNTFTYQDVGCFQRTFFCSFRKYNPFVALLRIFFDLFKEIHDIFILNNSYSQSLARK